MYEKMYRNIISQLKYAVFYFYKPRSTSMCMNAVVRFLEILKQYDQLIDVFF
jgi:peroxiredoxin